jgi:mitogen-activated protein kinase organizer 1
MLIKSYNGAHNYEVSDIAITTDNSRFVSVGGDKVGFLWDIPTGHVIRKFGSHHSRINCCALGGENSVMATGGYDCEVKIWDLKDKRG